MLVSVAGKKALKVILDRVFCIYYPKQFRKDKEAIRGLINLGNEVNTMTPAYTKKLGLWTQKTNIRAQKIDKSLLETYEMVIAAF